MWFRKKVKVKEDVNNNISAITDANDSELDPIPSTSYDTASFLDNESFVEENNHDFRTSSPKNNKGSFSNVFAKQADHSYSFSNDCQCGFDCCRKKQILINELVAKVEELEGFIKENGLKHKTRRIVYVKKTLANDDCEKYLSSDKQVCFYTGLRSIEHFNLLYNYVKEKVQKMPYWQGTKKSKVVVNRIRSKYKLLVSPKKRGTKRKLKIKTELLMVLMRLRLGLLGHDLADRFNVSEATVSSVFTTWIKVLAQVLKVLVYWPDKISVKANLPKCFEELYPNARCIIDCTEFFIDRPRNLALQAQTWSDYKHHNTLKVLIGISPRGSISFVSEAWGGRVSDRQITMESGILDYVDPKDQWLADRGFIVKEEFLRRGAELVVPPPGMDTVR